MVHRVQARVQGRWYCVFRKEQKEVFLKTNPWSLGIADLPALSEALQPEAPQHVPFVPFPRSAWLVDCYVGGHFALREERWEVRVLAENPNNCKLTTLLKNAVKLVGMSFSHPPTHAPFTLLCAWTERCEDSMCADPAHPRMPCSLVVKMLDWGAQDCWSEVCGGKFPLTTQQLSIVHTGTRCIRKCKNNKSRDLGPASTRPNWINP